MTEPKQGTGITTTHLSLMFAVMLQIVSLVWFSATQNAKIEDVVRRADALEKRDSEQDARAKEIEETARKERDRISDEGRTNDGAAFTERRILERRVNELEEMVKGSRGK